MAAEVVYFESSIPSLYITNRKEIGNLNMSIFCQIPSANGILDVRQIRLSNRCPMELSKRACVSRYATAESYDRKL